MIQGLGFVVIVFHRPIQPLRMGRRGERFLPAVVACLRVNSLSPIPRSRLSLPQDQSEKCRSARFPDGCVPARDWSFCAAGQSGSEIDLVPDLDNSIAIWDLFGPVRAVW
jgi:hypothetical protein